MPKTQNKPIKVFFSILVGVGLNLEKFQRAPMKNSSKSLFKGKNTSWSQNPKHFGLQCMLGGT